MDDVRRNTDGEMRQRYQSFEKKKRKKKKKNNKKHRQVKRNENLKSQNPKPKSKRDIRHCDPLVRHRGASHTMHFVALAGLLSIHVPHVHDALLERVVGGFIPAAAQLKPPLEAELAGSGAGALGGREDAAPGRGASQIVHFSSALAGFWSEHSEHVHVDPLDASGFLRPAAAQLNPATLGALEVAFEAEVEENELEEKSYDGSEDAGRALAASRALRELGPGPAAALGNETDNWTVYVGNSETAIALTAAFASRGVA